MDLCREFEHTNFHSTSLPQMLARSVINQGVGHSSLSAQMSEKSGALKLRQCYLNAEREEISSRNMGFGLGQEDCVSF